MGMDIMGHNPTTKKGEYFRNNVWYWRPMWVWLCDAFPNLVGDDPEMGHYNDGYGLDWESSVTLSDAIDEALADGRVLKYEHDFNEAKSQVGMEDCRWCNATGIRTDEVGIQSGMPDKELTEEVAIIVGRTHGYCNSCGGYGKVEPFAVNYHFTEENVREFSEFLRTCGGFGIH